VNIKLRGELKELVEWSDGEGDKCTRKRPPPGYTKQQLEYRDAMNCKEIWEIGVHPKGVFSGFFLKKKKKKRDRILKFNNFLCLLFLYMPNFCGTLFQKSTTFQLQHFRLGGGEIQAL
jgi:hypothetical protein